MKKLMVGTSLFTLLLVSCSEAESEVIDPVDELTETTIEFEEEMDEAERLNQEVHELESDVDAFIETL